MGMTNVVIIHSRMDASAFIASVNDKSEHVYHSCNISIF